MRIALISVALALAPVAAGAAPYVAIDATRQSLTFIDDGSVVRSGAVVNLDVVLVFETTRAMVVSLRIDCTARTWQQAGNRFVAMDGSIGPLLPATAPATSVQSGTVADSAMQRVCFGAAPKPGSWSVQTLDEAISDGRAAIKRVAAQP